MTDRSGGPSGVRQTLGAMTPTSAVLGGSADQRPSQTAVDRRPDRRHRFVRGVPVWASFDRVAEDGVPSVGVVSAPALQRRWWAAHGRGRVRIRRWCASTPAVGFLWQSCIRRACRFPVCPSRRGWVYVNLRLTITVWRVRAPRRLLSYWWPRAPSIFTAEPQVSGMGSVAALGIVVREAGGHAHQPGRRRRPQNGAVAANGLLHDECDRLNAGVTWRSGATPFTIAANTGTDCTTAGSSAMYVTRMQTSRGTAWPVFRPRPI